MTATYYRKHLFFCTNQRPDGRQCCNNAGAHDLCLYAKKRVKRLGLAGAGHVRVSFSGCLGRCKEGPSLVVYPDGIWYQYHTEADIDEILEQHIVNGQVVTRLLMEKKSQE